MGKTGLSEFGVETKGSWAWSSSVHSSPLGLLVLKVGMAITPRTGKVGLSISWDFEESRLWAGDTHPPLSWPPEQERLGFFMHMLGFQEEH